MGLEQMEFIRRQIADTEEELTEIPSNERKKSLIEELSRFAGGEEKPGVGTPRPKTMCGDEKIIYPDGYARRSRVQELYTPPDFLKRRRRKIAGLVLLAVLLLILAALLARMYLFK